MHWTDAPLASQEWKDVIYQEPMRKQFPMVEMGRQCLNKYMTLGVYLIFCGRSFQMRGPASETALLPNFFMFKEGLIRGGQYQADIHVCITAL